MTRIACLVPFCSYTTGKACEEWICSQHWKLVDRRLRLVYRKRRKRCLLGHAEELPECERTWQRIKIQAIERAGGIA